MCYIVCLRIVYVHVNIYFNWVWFTVTWKEVMKASWGFVYFCYVWNRMVKMAKNGYCYTHCNWKPACNTFTEMLGSLPHYVWFLCYCARFEIELGTLRNTHAAVFILNRVLLVCHLLLKYCLLFFKLLLLHCLFAIYYFFKRWMKYTPLVI
jgi:hypothetical protein